MTTTEKLTNTQLEAAGLDPGAATLIIHKSYGRIIVTHTDGTLLLSAHAPAGIWEKLVNVLTKDSLNPVGPMTTKSN